MLYFFIQGYEKVDKNYSHSAEGNESLHNNRIPYFDQIPDIKHMPTSENMPVSDHKRPPLSINV